MPFDGSGGVLARRWPLVKSTRSCQLSKTKSAAGVGAKGLYCLALVFPSRHGGATRTKQGTSVSPVIVRCVLVLLGPEAHADAVSVLDDAERLQSCNHTWAALPERMVSTRAKGSVCWGEARPLLALTRSVRAIFFRSLILTTPI